MPKFLIINHAFNIIHNIVSECNGMQILLNTDVIFQTAFVHYFTKLGTGDTYYWENGSICQDGGDMLCSNNKKMLPFHKEKKQRKRWSYLHNRKYG